MPVICYFLVYVTKMCFNLSNHYFKLLYVTTIIKLVIVVVPCLNLLLNVCDSDLSHPVPSINHHYLCQ